MLMYESLYAIGKFRESLAKHLDFNPDFYEHTKEGTSIITNVFTIESSIPENAELAKCLGVDPLDFNQHEVNPYSVNIDKLSEIFDSESIDSFIALREAKCIFFYKPNS